MDLTLRHVDLDHVPGVHLSPQSRTLEHRESKVNRVTEENPSERVGENRGHAERFQRDGGLFAARSAPEVVAGHDEVADLDAPGPGRIDGFEGVRCKHLGIGRAQILSRDDVVGRDIVPERPDAAAELTLHSEEGTRPGPINLPLTGVDRPPDPFPAERSQIFRGSVISPWIADAVTVQGEARYTWACGDPIRPG